VLLEVRGLHKRFGQITALNGLDIAVEQGEFFVLLGPSASGKTTTLRSIAGIEKVDSGQIIFADQDLTHAPVQGRPMAMVFQAFALYPHMSIYDNLAYPLREAGVSRAEIERRVMDIATMLRLTHTLRRKPETASGGEQQRIAIGRALIRQTQLLLLDEPITNLDAKLRHDTRAEFKRLHRDLGMTILYATPDELEALSMGQRIGVLRDGRIVQTGSPDELYERPSDTFVATMVGSPKMNLLPGKKQGDGAATAVALDFAELRSGPWSRALSDFPSGTELLFGFRPHDIEPVAGDGDPAGPAFTARVHLTEPLGDITVLDMNVKNHLFRMVLPEEQAVKYHVGDEFEVALHLERSYVFAAETGTAIH
jgi:multiple sugar transport system ATP-binding protein